MKRVGRRHQGEVLLWRLWYRGAHCNSPREVASLVVVVREGALLNVVAAGCRWLDPIDARGRGWRVTHGVAIA